MTVAELVFKIQTAGADQLKGVATAVESIGSGTRLTGANLKTFNATLDQLVGSGKTYIEALKEMSKAHGVLTPAVTSTSAALLKHLGVVEEVEVATHKLVGANVAAGAAIRDLTGQSNIRGIENLLSNVLGLGSAFQSMFVITGLVAAGEMLYKLWEKFDPLTIATKKLAEENKKLDQTYVTATANIERYIEQQARATLGASAAKAVAAYNAGTQRAEMARGASDAQAEIEKLRKNLYVTTPATTTGAGFGNHGEGKQTIPAESHINRTVEANIRTLEAKVDGFNLMMREFDAKQKADDDQAAADKKKEDKAAGRPAAELKKRQAEDLVEINKRLEELRAKELFGLDAILAKEKAIFDARHDGNLPATVAVLAAEKEVTAELIKQFNVLMAKDAIAIAGDMEENQEKNKERRRKDALADLVANGKFESEEFKRDATALARVEARGDSAEDERIRRAAQTPVLRGKKDATDDPVARELQSYRAMVDASNAIFLNDTKRLDIAKLDADLKRVQIDDEFHLTADQRSDEEALAEARKKNADELYTLQEQHRAALANEQREDLQKYESMAGKIFAALSGKRGSFQQMLKGAALGQAGQIFSNLTTPILQAAGHTLGGLTGGSTAGGILKGTILDPKNAETIAAKSTADNTKDTANWVEKTFHLLSGNGSTDPATATGAAGNGSAVTPSTGGILNTVGKATGLSGLFGSIKQVLGLGAGTSSPTGDIGGSPLGGGIMDMKAALPAAPMTTAQMVGSAATIATGALAVAAGISHGGASGALTATGGAVAAAGAAISAVAKLASAASPILAAAGPIGMAVGAVLPMIASFLPDSHALRAQAISNEINKNQYLPNTAMNVTQSGDGMYEDFDAHGLLRTSTLRAVPTVAEPYITSKRLNSGDPLTYANAPGSVISPFSTAPAAKSAPAASTTIIIHAMDSETLNTYFQKPANAHVLGEAVATHLQQHEGRLSQELRYVTGTGPGR